MAQSQGWVKRYIKAFCKGFFVAVPVAVTFLDRVACVARVEGASMQPSLNPGGSQSSDVVLLNHWKVRNFEVHRGDIVSLVSPKNPEQKIIKRVIALEGDIVRKSGSRQYIHFCRRKTSPTPGYGVDPIAESCSVADTLL
ncbi:mitochondrial inner membrane protease subunit 2 isoform X2 [Papio anubis]|uniref:mitochondrial inner membrane protease subunit 2 isoform X2 n=1 Tax=Papio anubis TaxID=9555 RepID=UPI000B7B6CFF|nr:mitochondrial inner membrane protease subunit 2 isoform X2 [Papio anubis]